VHLQLCYAGQNHIRVIGSEGWAELDPATSYRLHMRVKIGNRQKNAV